jgi:murein DD-endopeptidase MepM/ murein hydrolase activator NlpD
MEDRLFRQRICSAVEALTISSIILIATSLSLRAADVKAQAGASSSKAWSVHWQPPLVVNGSPILFQVKPAAQMKSVSGKWLGHDVPFALDPKTKTWNALAGVGFEVKPGVYTLTLNGVAPNGKESSFERRIKIGAAKYRTIAITVESKYTEPSKEQLEIINRDKQIKQGAFSHVSEEREWTGDFKPPVDAPFSDTFGTQRTFNGQVRSVHQGLDFAATAGTPIVAINAGTVLLARSLYFEGNFVVVGHGQGLLTLYLHMSEIKVKEGDKVARGQELGLVGGTGRATGPHLHLAVRWQGIYLDPATLLKMKLP